MAIRNVPKGLVAWMVTMVTACLQVHAQPTWKRVYGGLGVDLVHDALVTANGDIVVVGSTGSFGHGASDVYLLKVDGNGVRTWSTTLGGPFVDEARAMVEMDDGGYVVVGTTNGTPSGDYNGLVMRTDIDGRLLWQRTYGGGDWDFLYGVDRVPGGGVVAAGLSYSRYPGGEAWLLRLDDNGDTLWTARFGGQGYSDARSVKATMDGGYVLAGATTSARGDLDAFVVKLGTLGNVEWANAYGGDSTDLAREVILTVDGGYSVVGTTRSFGPVTEHYHVKLDAAGGREWQHNWGQISHQEGYRHIQLANGEYASIGFVTQGGAGGKDMFLLRSRADGSFILGQTQGGAADDIGHALVRMDGGYLMCGITESYGCGMWDIFLVRTNEVGFTDSNDVFAQCDPLRIPERDRAVAMFGLYPNPSMGTFHFPSSQPLVHVRIIDAVGRVVDEQGVPPGSGSFTTRVPSGSYVVEGVLATGEVGRSRIQIVRH